MNTSEPIDVYIEYKKYAVYANHIFEKLMFELLKDLRINVEKEFFSVDLYKIVEILDKYSFKYNEIFEEFIVKDSTNYNFFLKEPSKNDKIFDIATIKLELEEIQNKAKEEEIAKNEEKNNLVRSIINKVKKLRNIESFQNNYSKIIFIKNNYDLLLNEMSALNICEKISKKYITELL